MTLLYGRDANGNQVPLLVDGSGIVQTSGGSTSWPGTSSQLTAGDGTAVTVGSGLSLAAGTLTAGGYSTVWDVDWRTQTSTSFGSSPTTQSINGIPVKFQVAFIVSGATGNYSISANGLRLQKTGGSVGSSFYHGCYWADMTSLGVKFNAGLVRYWYMYDTTLNGWLSATTAGDFEQGGATSTNDTTFAQFYDSSRGVGWASPGVPSSLAIGSRASNMTTQSTNLSVSWNTYNVHVVEFRNGIVSCYGGPAAVNNTWPQFDALTQCTNMLLTNSWFMAPTTGYPPTPAYSFNIMQLTTNMTLGLLRSRIDIGA